jgi:DNA-3-methyladenine glycosylase
MPKPLSRAFFKRDPITCARELIGCTLVWNDCSGVIAETEAYAAVGDEAAHTWNRPSARAFVANHQAGAAYVYFNYGMYWMLNVLVKSPAGDGFVLFRALEPLEGVAKMEERRARNRRKGTGALAANALCSGPGKLAQALDITGADHGRDFCADPAIRILPAATPANVDTCVRIGISRAQDFPWRFLLAHSGHVSVPPRAARSRKIEEARPSKRSGL